MHEIVSIIGCGPSALKCGAASARGFRIAVNGAAFHVEHDAVLTMDGRFARNRAHELAGHIPFYVRRRAWNKIDFEELRRDGVRLPRSVVFDCDNHSTTFGETQTQLNGDHSGYCALNLAYVLRPKRVYLYGFDLDGKDPSHFFGEYDWFGFGSRNSPQKFEKWRNDMYQADAQFLAAGIEVFNTNPASAITAIPYGAP